MNRRLRGAEEAEAVATRRRGSPTGSRPVDSVRIMPPAHTVEQRPLVTMQPARLLPLQRAAGNRALGQLIRTHHGATGDTVRTPTVQRLKEPVVTHPKLQNLVRDLYKGAHMKRGKKIGDGSTADAIRAERQSGGSTRGVFHDEKGRQYIQALTNWLNKRGPNGGVSASLSDRKAAQDLIDDLNGALDS